jgi:hypothetical protein
MPAPTVRGTGHSWRYRLGSPVGGFRVGQMKEKYVEKEVIKLLNDKL